MESLNANENPDFGEMRGLVENLIKTEHQLNPEENFIPQVYPNVNNLVMIEYLLRKHSKFAADSFDSEIVGSPVGDAISPTHAARCLRDYIRSSRFITGLHAAIKKAQEKFPGEKIRILDAGCGPFALLSVATATQFSPDEVEYSLLDYHKQSIENSRAIIANLGMENYFDQFICGDAVKIDLQDHLKKRPHIIVAEVMNTALMEEPQVAVTKNMVPQMEEDGLFVPENVTVSASLLTSTHKITLGRIIELTKEQVLNVLNDDDDREKGVTVEKLFPVPMAVQKALMVLDTDIHVFGDQRLQLSDCFITRAYEIGTVKKLRTRDNVRLKVKFGGNRFDIKFSLE